PGQAGQHGGISKDGRSALVTLELGKKGDVDKLLAATAAAQKAHPSLRIEEFGEASADKALNKSLGDDFSRAETLSLPITLAIQAAAATSGRAILVSGLTVIIAMAGMFFAGSKVFTSFAVGTIMVVAVAMVGSLTVLPAMMSALGRRVEKGRIPLLHRLRRSG